MMAVKLYTHKVTISDKRRKNKKRVGVLKKGMSKDALSQVFNLYYRDQVRALYRTVSREK
ncbi:MAG: hypothetical protein ABIH85_00555 [Candidatus Omnitrophota bacterium]|nr:hypothetical protein [Candidatus Omnitrophota bacterium]